MNKYGGKIGMRMYPYLNGKMINGGAMASAQNETSGVLRGIAKVDGFVAVVIGIAIALAIYSQLGASTVAPGITHASDTANITGYNTWDSQTQSTYKASANNISLVWFILPFILLMYLLKGL
jgi:hypothetical protein